MKRLSVWLAMRCREADFWEFLGVENERTAIAAVRAMCDVQSRKEIDTNEIAAHLFHQLIRLPYSEFLTEKEKSHV